MDVKIDGFTVTGLPPGSPVNINIAIGGGSPDNDNTGPVNISDDFQAPIDRPANIADTAEDITAEQNSRFVEQFAANLIGDPIHGDAAAEALSAVENLSEGGDAKKKKK